MFWYVLKIKSIIKNMIKKSETQVVKNQHYIPESLIRHFADEKNMVHEILLSTKKIYQTNIRNVMSEKFIYEHDKLKKNTIENYFAKIEDDIAPKIIAIIEKIDKCRGNDGSVLEIKNDIEELLPVIIMFYYRSGALIKEFSSINEKDKIPLLSEKILNYEYINNLAETIRTCYKFAIIISENEFLLSDQYMSTAAIKMKTRFTDRSNRSIGLIETMIMIPISSSCYVVYWHSDDDFFVKENSITHLDSESIKMINRVIINNSYNKCVSKRSDSIIEVLDYYKVRSPSQIYIGYNSGYTSGAILKKEVFFHHEEMEAYEMLQFAKFNQYKDLSRNENCACGSQKKFKKCHGDAYKRSQQIMRTFGKSGQQFFIPGVKEIELPIDEWRGYSNKN